jgi:hypothetical protein
MSQRASGYARVDANAGLGDGGVDSPSAAANP